MGVLGVDWVGVFGGVGCGRGFLGCGLGGWGSLEARAI